MARTRLLKPGFFSSDQLAQCSPLARLCFAGLWTIADRAGKLRDRPRKIKAELFPYEAVESTEDWLAELARVGLIQRYEGPDGVRYLKVLEFLKHQSPHPKEPTSEIPEPCTDPVEPCNSATSREKDVSSPAFNPSPFLSSSLSLLPREPRPGEREHGAGLGPLGAELVRRVEEGLGRSLSPAKNGQAEALEQRIAAHGGVEQACAFIAATYRTHRKSEPQSVGWLATVLRGGAGRDT